MRPALGDEIERALCLHKWKGFCTMERHDLANGWIFAPKGRVSVFKKDKGDDRMLLLDSPGEREDVPPPQQPRPVARV